MTPSPTQFASLVEEVAHGVLQVLGQTLRTFRDLLFRPARFARVIAGPSGKTEYLRPYTFLILAGYLGVKVLVSILTWLATFNQQFNFTVDTLQQDVSVWDAVARLPTMKEVLLMGVPMVIAIHLLGLVYRRLVTPVPQPVVEQSLYYTAGLQYLLLAVVAFSLNHLGWSGWPYAEGVTSVLGHPIALAALLVGLPSYLLGSLARRAILPGGHRFRRYVTAKIAVIAFFVTLIGLALPWGGLAVYVVTTPLDLKKMALLRVTLAGEGRIEGNAITMGLLLRNQSDRQVALLAEPVTLITSPAMGWQGRLADGAQQADVIVLSPRESKTLRFVGQHSGTRGLDDAAWGRLKLMELKDDGSRVEVDVHAWRPVQEDESDSEE